MPLKTFSTPFTETLLGMLLISPNNGTGFTLSDPGVYTLSCIVDWYHATSDSQALGDMTKVAAGDEVTIEVTDTPVTWYCKIEHVGDQAPLVFKYDQPAPAVPLPTIPTEPGWTALIVHNGVAAWDDTNWLQGLTQIGDPTGRVNIYGGVDNRQAKIRGLVAGAGITLTVVDDNIVIGLAE